jgi:uroporphyrinogen decarboxylase
MVYRRIQRSVHVTEKHIETAKDFTASAKANDGLASVDLRQFWEDQEKAIANPFGRNIPQLPLGAICNWECVFAELGIEQDWKRYQEDSTWREELHKAYNDKSEKIVGKRLLSEGKNENSFFCGIKPLYGLFEMENVWDNVSQSYWHKKSAHTPDELESLLDRVDERLENPNEFFLPENWAVVKSKIEKSGKSVRFFKHQRGPVTFAMSMFGVEDLIYLIIDKPELAKRFSDTIAKAMHTKIDIHNREAGCTAETAPKGFSFADDNCAMLNADMYEFFAYPILKSIWDRMSPDETDSRYQHSDSDMRHLLPILGRLKLTGTNFGPNVMVNDIRKHLPGAVIFGELAPFTYSRNEEVNMVAELLRDYELIGDTRGLVFHTAGSINNGSRLTGMRLLMGAIQKYCRYD